CYASHTPQLPYTSFFSFNPHRDHRHLHSFPTRRSSDLYPKIQSAVVRRYSSSASKAPSAPVFIEVNASTASAQSNDEYFCGKLLLSKKTTSRNCCAQRKSECLKSGLAIFRKVVVLIKYKLG